MLYWKHSEEPRVERLTELHEELQVLNAEAHELEECIAENMFRLLDSLR
jgi:hypothetical protein